MVRVNNLTNLEALLNIIANGMEILGIAWGGPTMAMGFVRGDEAQSKALLGKLGELRQLIERALPGVRAGHTDDAELEGIDFKLKEAARAADRIRASWPRPGPGGDGTAVRFLQLLADAGDLTVGPDPLGSANWLVASARDANLFS